MQSGKTLSQPGTIFICPTLWWLARKVEMALRSGVSGCSIVPSRQQKPTTASHCQGTHSVSSPQALRGEFQSCLCYVPLPLAPFSGLAVSGTRKASLFVSSAVLSGRSTTRIPTLAGCCGFLADRRHSQNARVRAGITD